MRASILPILLSLAVAACGAAQPTGPAGEASSNAVNPATGTRTGGNR